jgi:altronate dehydratase
VRALWLFAANPLIGSVARELIRSGGAALLAETPELVGAESYVLRNVKDLDTSKRTQSH